MFRGVIAPRGAYQMRDGELGYKGLEATLWIMADGL